MDFFLPYDNVSAIRCIKKIVDNTWCAEIWHFSSSVQLDIRILTVVISKKGSYKTK